MKFGFPLFPTSCEIEIYFWSEYAAVGQVCKHELLKRGVLVVI